jgi:virulence-associated protein VagC
MHDELRGTAADRGASLRSIAPIAAIAKQWRIPSSGAVPRDLRRFGTRTRCVAVRIPREFAIEGSEVLIHEDGERLVLTPVRRHRLANPIAGWARLAGARVADPGLAAPTEATVHRSRRAV